MGQVCISETSLIHEEWSSPDERNNDLSLDIGIMTRVVLDGMKTTKRYVAQL